VRRSARRSSGRWASVTVPVDGARPVAIRSTGARSRCALEGVTVVTGTRDRPHGRRRRKRRSRSTRKSRGEALPMRRTAGVLEARRRPAGRCVCAKVRVGRKCRASVVPLPRRAGPHRLSAARGPAHRQSALSRASRHPCCARFTQQLRSPADALGAWLDAEPGAARRQGYDLRPTRGGSHVLRGSRLADLRSSGGRLTAADRAGSRALAARARNRFGNA
jgi:hypothetical protein